MTPGIRQLLLRCSTSGIHAVACQAPLRGQPCGLFKFVPICTRLILRLALRANLRLFKIVQDNFVEPPKA